MIVPPWKEQLKGGVIKAPPEFVAKELPSGVVRKAALPPGTLRFRMSQQTPDRYGDLVTAAGFRLENFVRNSPAPWSHSLREPPVGRWDNVHVEGIDLIGDLTFVPREISPKAWMIFQMYAHEPPFLRAVSVGFQPIRWAWNEERGRYAVDYLEQELLECSTVTVGAQANALVLNQARAVGIDVGPMVEDCRRLLDESEEDLIWAPRAVLEKIVADARSQRIFDLAGGAGRALWARLGGEGGGEGGEEPAPDAPAEKIAADLPPPKAPTPDLTLPVDLCACCGGSHDAVVCRPRASAGEGWTHHGSCPKTREPLFFTVSAWPAEKAAGGAAARLEDEGCVELNLDELKSLLADPKFREALATGVDEALVATTGELRYPDDNEEEGANA